MLHTVFVIIFYNTNFITQDSSLLPSLLYCHFLRTTLFTTFDAYGNYNKTTLTESPLDRKSSLISLFVRYVFQKEIKLLLTILEVSFTTIGR